MKGQSPLKRLKMTLQIMEAYTTSMPSLMLFMLSLRTILFVIVTILNVQRSIKPPFPFVDINYILYTLDDDTKKIVKKQCYILKSKPFILLRNLL